MWKEKAFIWLQKNCFFLLYNCYVSMIVLLKIFFWSKLSSSKAPFTCRCVSSIKGLANILYKWVIGMTIVWLYLHTVWPYTQYSHTANKGLNRIMGYRIHCRLDILAFFCLTSFLSYLWTSRCVCLLPGWRHCLVALICSCRNHNYCIICALVYTIYLIGVQL